MLISMAKKDIGSPIKEFVRQSVKEVEEALPKGYSVIGNMNFDLSVVNKKSKRGKADIRVIGIGGQAEIQNVQRISFSVGNPERSKQETESALSAFRGFLQALKELDQPKKNKGKRK